MKRTTIAVTMFTLGLAANSARAEPLCDNTDSGLTPLDLLVEDYVGFGGHVYAPGLYGPGRFDRPQAHTDAGLMAAKEAATPRTPTGEACNAEPGPGCQYAIVSVSMSNGTQAWSGNTPEGNDPSAGFVEKVAVSSERAAHLVAVDAARGGTPIECMAGHSDCTQDGLFEAYWQGHVPTRLNEANVTAEQVTIVWLYPGNHQEGNPDHVANMTTYIADTIAVIRATFPNVAIIYLHSREYGGYAPAKNNEPFAYEQGLACRNVIAQQLDGAPELCHGAPGCTTPWLDWGAYVWANGTTTANSMGLTWNCDDFRQDDGQHPSLAGVDKISDAMITYFSTDTVARQWFLADPGTDGGGSTGGGSTGGGSTGGSGGSATATTGATSNGGSTDGAGGDTDTAGSTAGDNGCGCATGNTPQGLLGSLLAFGLLGLSRRRQA